MIGKRIQKTILLVIALILTIITGCSGRARTAPEDRKEIYFVENESIDGSDAQYKKDAGDKNAAEDNSDPENPDPVIAQISESCCDIFEQAVKTNTTDSLEVVRSIVGRLGEDGYTAVDSKNQMNMTEYERAADFCEKAQAGEKAELTVFSAAYTGGLTKYELYSENGNLDIVKSYYQYENGHLANKSTVSYSADFWQYTEEGYFLFIGSYYSQDYYIFALSDMPVCTALRVQPLDDKCRELNRKYILPIGYGKNNMFISDWSEQDFGSLDFYDLFDKFYPLANGEEVPYRMDENLGVGAVYRIPGDEFQNAIMEYLNITPEILRSKTNFSTEDGTYEYKPRGLYEVESPELPYPEVVAYEENDDGTVILTVNVVYPERKKSKVFAHEVVIRPLEEGRFQYISNRVIPSEDNGEPTWHRPRLTEERWEEFYGVSFRLSEFQSSNSQKIISNLLFGCKRRRPSFITF